MVKICVFGINGKMGSAIESMLEHDTEAKIVCGIDGKLDRPHPFKVYNNLNLCTEKFDVLIDFSRPEALTQILEFSKNTKTPVIICTTGFNSDQKAQIFETAKTAPVFFSYNMSIGVNLLVGLIKQATEFLGSDYDVEIIEKHHNKKVDAPSGTALMLADSVKSARPQLEYVNGRSGISKREINQLGIHAVRGGNIVGEHEVMFIGTNEVISFSHSASSKEVFASGAIKAAKFMKDKSCGLYDMANVLNQTTK